MKTSLTFSIAIAATVAVLGWRGHLRLGQLTTERTRLAEKAGELGISGESRVTKRQREDEATSARLLAAECIASMADSGCKDGSAEQRLQDLEKRMAALDANGLEIFLARIREARDLDDESRRKLINAGVMMLSVLRPASALAIATALADLFKNRRDRDIMLMNALDRLATDDSAAAMDWFRKNSFDFPPSVSQELSKSMLQGMARGNPRKALQLLGTMESGDRRNIVFSVAESCENPDQKSAFLTNLREYLKTIPNDAGRAEIEQQAIGGLTISFSHAGSAYAREWAESARLTSQELAIFADQVGNAGNLGGSGQWAEWYAWKLPEEVSGPITERLVGDWTTKDYRAAGEWLAASGDFPGKNLAVRSYAETVAKYDPETAALWADTIPADVPYRKDTFRGIYARWPKSDEASKAAAEAFAKSHGIQ